MKTFLFFLAFSVTSYALDVTQAIDIAYKNNPDIKQLKAQIDGKNYDITNSRILRNPILSFGFNDINLHKPLQRDIEAMQTNYVTISQEIEQDEKLKLKEKIEKLKQRKLYLSLENKKAVIKKDIYSIYYKLETINNSKKYLDKKIENINKINKYYTHSAIAKSMEIILENKINIEKLQIQLDILENKKEKLNAKLQKILSSKIESGLTNNVIPDFTFTRHPLMEIRDIDVYISKLGKQLETKKKTPNYTLSGGYFQRDSRDDYINLSIKIPLTIYSRENNNINKALHITNTMIEKKILVKNDLNEKYSVAKANKSVTNKMILLTKKLLKNLEEQIALISSNNNFSSIAKIYKLKNRLIEFKIKSLGYQEQYMISDLNLKYLKGINDDK